MSDNKTYLIECDNLVKIYKTKDIEVMALQGLDIAIEAGELMAIVGNSGSGKSTFLNMIGGLDRPPLGQRPGHQADGLLAESAHGNELHVELAQLLIESRPHYPNLPVM